MVGLVVNYDDSVIATSESINFLRTRYITKIADKPTNSNLKFFEFKEFLTLPVSDFSTIDLIDAIVSKALIMSKLIYFFCGLYDDSNMVLAKIAMIPFVCAFVFRSYLTHIQSPLNQHN